MKPGQKQERQEQQKSDQNPEENPGETRNDKVADGELPKSKVAKLWQKLLGKEQWGLLPQKLREKMNSSEGKQYPREYRGIIKRYYERMGKLSNGR